MTEILITSGIASLTAFLGWLFGNLKTRRQKRESDFETVNKTVKPLLDSLKELTEQNNDLVKQLLEEQDKRLKLIIEKSEWMRERNDLIEKIENLEKQVSILTKRVNGVLKKNDRT